MPVREITPVSATAVSDGGATEKVVLTSSPVNTSDLNRQVTLHGVLNITPGTASTNVVVRVRRGSGTSGTEVGSATTDTTTAGDDYTVPFSVSDIPGEVAGLVYSVTVTETSATADGTVNYGLVGGLIG